MALESFQVKGVAPGTYTFSLLLGGYYAMSAHATTWGTLVLQMAMPDPAPTFVSLFGQPSNATPQTNVANLAADGVLYFYLPPGTYQLVFAAGTVLYASVSQVPLE